MEKVKLLTASTTAHAPSSKQFKDLAHALDFAVATLRAAEEKQDGRKGSSNR